MGRSRSRSRSRDRRSKKSKSKSRRRSRTRSQDRSHDRHSHSRDAHLLSSSQDNKSRSPIKQKEHALDLLERMSSSKKSLDELLLSGETEITTRGDSELSLYEHFDTQKINVINIHSKGSKVRSRSDVDSGQGSGEFLSLLINKIIHDINKTMKLPKLGIFDRREIREFVEPPVETKISLRLPSKDELEKLEEKFVSSSRKDKDRNTCTSRSQRDSGSSSRSQERNERRDNRRDIREDREKRDEKTVFKVSGIFDINDSMASDDKSRRSVQHRLGGNQAADSHVSSTSGIAGIAKTSNLTQRLGWMSTPVSKIPEERSKSFRNVKEEKIRYDPSIPEFRTRNEHDDRDTWRGPRGARSYRTRPDGPVITDQRFKIPKISQLKPRKKEPDTWVHDKFEGEEPSSTTS